MDYSHLLDETQPSPPEKSLSVADFLKKINTSLARETHRIQGEVTSINKSYGKAIYFSIKDSQEEAKLDCIIWKSVYDQNGVDVEVGDEIIISGNPEIYAPQGRFSLKASTIEYAGEGALKKAYDILKEKLTQEGVFERERKKLPKYPTKIGVVTSLSGVVIHDFTTNLEQHGYELVIIDSRVEGKEAIHELRRSLNTLKKQNIDLLVIMRGGGSWESLQAFNTESLVRAIADFPVPVLTGIGHDVDVTLAELVADKGVSTPTAVAKTINEPWKILDQWLQKSEIKTLSRFEQELISSQRSTQDSSQTLLRHYFQTIQQTDKSLQIQTSKTKGFFQKIHEQTSVVHGIFRNILRSTSGTLEEARKTISLSKKTAAFYTNKTLSSIKENLLFQEKTLEIYNPNNNLKRGYSILYKDDKIVRSIDEIKPDEQITTKIFDGTITSQIKKITK